MAKRGVIRQELGHGAAPRKGWRMAWYEPRRRVGVFFPAPLHRIAGALRELKWRVEVARKAPTRERHEVFDVQRAYREEQKLAAEFARGYLRGWQECVDAWEATAEARPEEGGWQN